MFLGEHRDYGQPETPQPPTPLFIPRAQYWPQTDRVEVILSPRRPTQVVRQSDEIEIHLSRSVLRRYRVVGLTIHNIDSIHRQNIRQNGMPLRGVVSISSILRVLHRMELRNKERMFGKYRGQIERALEKHPVTVCL